MYFGAPNRTVVVVIVTSLNLFFSNKAFVIDTVEVSEAETTLNLIRIASILSSS